MPWRGYQSYYDTVDPGDPNYDSEEVCRRGSATWGGVRRKPAGAGARGVFLGSKRALSQVIQGVRF